MLALATVATVAITLLAAPRSVVAQATADEAVQESLPEPAGIPGWHGASSDFHDPGLELCLEGDAWNEAVDAAEHPQLLRLQDFFSRSTETHGRSMGTGEPLRGTSWLNRPYEVSYQFGAFIMPTAPASGAPRDNDFFGSLHLGRDFDHYWGVEFRLGLSTPELNPSPGTGLRDSDTLTLADLGVMYYPWGDSRVRPYLRAGLGLTDIEFTSGGTRQQESLFTVPFGFGVKYLSWRSAAWRAELINNFAIQSNGADTMGNLTLSFGIEHRFGGPPEGYWAWRSAGTLK
ncbi:MAG: outer membrane beta-barrel protein [Planctomycetota bacterium]